MSEPVSAYGSFWDSAAPNTMAREERSENWLYLDVHRQLWRLRPHFEPGMPFILEAERAHVPFNEEWLETLQRTGTLGIAREFEDVTDERGVTHRVPRPQHFKPRP